MFKNIFLLLLSLGLGACGKSNFSYQDAISQLTDGPSTIKIEQISPKLYQGKELSLTTHLLNGAKGSYRQKMSRPGQLSLTDSYSMSVDPSEFNFDYKFDCFLPLVWELNSSKTELDIKTGYFYEKGYQADSQQYWYSFAKYSRVVNQIFHVFNSHFQKEKEGKVFYEVQSSLEGYQNFPILGWIIEKPQQLELHILIKKEDALQILTVTYEG